MLYDSKNDSIVRFAYSRSQRTILPPFLCMWATKIDQKFPVLRSPGAAAGGISQERMVGANGLISEAVTERHRESRTGQQWEYWCLIAARYGQWGVVGVLGLND